MNARVLLLIVALLAGACGDSKEKPDCEKYVAKRVELALEGRSGKDRSTMERRVRVIAGDSCHAGKVSVAEAKCVMTARTNDEARACATPGGKKSLVARPSHTPTSASKPASPAQATKQAVGLYFELMTAFADAFYGGKVKKEPRCADAVPRVKAMLAAGTAKRDRLVALLKDPAVARPALAKMLRPSGADPGYDIKQRMFAIFMHGYRASCGLKEVEWHNFLAPVYKLLEPYVSEKPQPKR